MLATAKAMIRDFDGTTQVWKNWMDKVDHLESWSPDIIQLENKRYQPLFVYDTMMKGGREHHLIENNYKVEQGMNPSPTVFTQERFELWKANRPNASYPIALRNGSSAAPLEECNRSVSKVYSARIKGQLFMVRSSAFLELDKERHNGLLFKREWVNVSHPYRIANGCRIGMSDSRLSQEYVQNVRAHMYVGDYAYWEKLLDGGCYFKPVQMFKPRPGKWLIEPFYHFLDREDPNI